MKIFEKKSKFNTFFVIFIFVLLFLHTYNHFFSIFGDNSNFHWSYSFFFNQSEKYTTKVKAIEIIENTSQKTIIQTEFNGEHFLVVNESQIIVSSDNFSEQTKKIQIILELHEMKSPQNFILPFTFSAGKSINEVFYLNFGQQIKISLDYDKYIIEPIIISNNNSNILILELWIPQTNMFKVAAKPSSEYIAYFGGLFFITYFFLKKLIVSPLCDFFYKIKLFNSLFCMQFTNPQDDSVKSSRKSALFNPHLNSFFRIPTKNKGLTKQKTKVNFSPKDQIFENDEKDKINYEKPEFVKLPNKTIHDFSGSQIDEIKEDEPISLNNNKFPLKRRHGIRLPTIEKQTSLVNAMNNSKNEKDKNPFGLRVTCVESEKISSKEIKLDVLSNKTEKYRNNLKLPPLFTHASDGHIKAHKPENNTPVLPETNVFNIKIKPKFMDFCVFLLKKCCKKVSNKNVELMEKGFKIMSEISSPLHCFKKNEEFEKLKRVLLDRNQLRIFQEYSKNLRIVLEAKNELLKPKYEELFENHNLSLLSFHLDLMKSFQIVKDRKAQNQVDERLLRLMEGNDFLVILEKLNFN